MEPYENLKYSRFINDHQRAVFHVPSKDCLNECTCIEVPHRAITANERVAKYLCNAFVFGGVRMNSKRCPEGLGNLSCSKFCQNLVFDFDGRILDGFLSTIRLCGHSSDNSSGRGNSCCSNPLQRLYATKVSSIELGVECFVAKNLDEGNDQHAIHFF